MAFPGPFPRMWEKLIEAVDKAIYGNGEPGIGECVRDLNKRVGTIETLEKQCRIGDAVELLDDIAERHAREDEDAKKVDADRIARTAEMRKFRYGLLSAVILFALDMLARVFKIF